jgi:hypothetical protein
VAELVVRRPEPGDVEWIAQRMRAQDRAELAALGRHDVEEVLRESLARSTLAWTTTSDGEPIVIGGAAPLRSLLDDVGVPWLLGTDVAMKHQRAFMTVAPIYIGQMLQTFSHLLNYVHVDNTVSRRWLKRVGFTLAEPAPFGPLGAPFCRFEMSRNHV